MRLDSAFYNNIIGVFDLYMNKIFSTDIKKTETVCKFENRGFFRLGYEYSPNHYKIVVRNDYNMYFCKDGKLYRKNSEGVKRIKHIEELFNG